MRDLRLERELCNKALATNEIVVSKARSTPRELTAGVMDCVGKSGVRLAAMETLFHGSTVVINAIIERQGARTGLVTTKGFRDVLEIGRGNRPANYDAYFRQVMRDEAAARAIAKAKMVADLNYRRKNELVPVLKSTSLEAQRFRNQLTEATGLQEHLGAVHNA